MTTITAEAFAMNIERYLKQAIKHGLQVVTADGHTLRVALSAPLTANGMTEQQEQLLLDSIQEAEADLQAGRYTTLRTQEELTTFLDSL